MGKFISRSLAETDQIATNLLKRISADNTGAQSAFIVGLSGHLGAGKTAFVKSAAKALGIREDITSPTFVIMKIYDAEHSRFGKLVHIDAYRLKTADELVALGFKNLAADAGNLIMIEWPENVEGALPRGRKTPSILFEAEGVGERSISIKNYPHIIV